MKFMNLKRFASTALAGVLALSMAAPAFAASNTTEITGSYEAITLSVVVPTTGKAVINPYGLPYKLNSEISVSGQQITTAAPLLIQNKSSVALAVTAEITTTATTGVTLDAAGASTNYDTDTTKNIQVNFQAFEAEGIDGNNATETDVLLPKFVALEDDDAKLTAVLSTSAAANTTGNLVLREAKDGEMQNGGAAFFRLSGKATKKADWEATDGFTASIAFSFEPSTYSKSAGAFGTAPSLDADTGTARNLTLTLAAGVTPDTNGITWTWASSDGADVTLADASASGAYAVKITPNTKGSVTITASFVGTDGLTYTATSDAITISGT